MNESNNGRRLYVRLNQDGGFEGAFDMPVEYDMEQAKASAREFGHRILSANDYEAEQNGDIRVRVLGGQAVIESTKQDA